MTPSERYKQDFTRPLKDGTGLKPRQEWIDYKGIPLTADVAKRIKEYRDIPSYVPGGNMERILP